MADKNIEIGIKTTADTTGAVAAETALEKVSEQTEKINQEEAKRATEQRAADQAADVRRIKTIQIAQVMGQVGQATAAAAGSLRDFARDLEKIDPDLAGDVEGVAGGFDAVAASAQGAAAGMFLLGPPGALIGAVVAPALGKLKEEALGAVESFAKLKEIEKIAEGLPARFEAVKQSLLVEQQSKSWQALLEKIGETQKEAESLARVAQARRDLEEFQAAQQVALAKAGGGDVAGAEENLRSVQAANFDAAQAEKIRTAEDALVKAQTEYAISQGLAARDAAKNSEEQQRMAEDIAKYRAALAEATRKLSETREITAIEGEKFGIGRETQNQVRGIEQTRASETATVQGINTLVDAIGTGGSKELQAAAQSLAQMASDNVLSADDLQKSTTLLSRFANQIINLGQQQNSALQDAMAKVDELTRQVNNLRTNSTQAPR